MDKHPLRKYLDANGWSVATFLERKRLSFSRSFIQSVLSGVANFRKASAEKISEATGIPKEVLMFPEDYQNFTPKP